MESQSEDMKKRKDEFACLYFCKILVIAFKEMQFGYVRLFYHVIIKI